jgi:hypothetical protein
MWSDGAAWSTAGSGNALIATNSRIVGKPEVI